MAIAALAADEVPAALPAVLQHAPHDGQAAAYNAEAWLGDTIYIFSKKKFHRQIERTFNFLPEIVKREKQR
jgi:hypothetical protein